MCHIAHIFKGDEPAKCGKRHAAGRAFGVSNDPVRLAIALPRVTAPCDGGG